MGKKAQEILKARNKKTSKESKVKVWGSVSPQADLDNLRLSHGGSGIDREYDRLSNLTMSDVKGWNSPDTTYRSPSLSMTSDRVQEWINRYNADVDKEAEKAGERGAATAAMSPGVSPEASRSKYRENFKSENKIKGLDENGKAVFSGDKNLPKNAIIDRVFNDDKLSDGEKSYLLYDVFGYTTQDTDAYGNTPERYETAYKIKTAKGENKAQSWYTMKSDDGKEFKLSGEAKDAVDRDLDNGVTKNALHLTPTGYTPKSKEEAEAIDAYRTMRMSERKAEQKKQADEERRKNMSTGEKVVSTLKMLDADVSRGVSGFTRGFWSTLDMLTLHQIPIIGDFHKAAVNTDEYLNRVAQEGADNLGGGGWHLFNNITQETSRNVVRMLPLILTGGTSAAGDGAVALSTQGQNAAAAIARNPNFIMTLTEMLGPAYDEAKEKGANELQAYSYALTAGTLNALVEIGGGVDVLPTQIRRAGGKTAKEMIKDWATSAIEEGNEEVVQGIISKTFEKAFFNPKVKLADFSSAQGFIAPGENTIISPFRAAQEWGLGAAMGGILGGGQIGVSAIENIMANRDATAEYGLNFIVEGDPTITSQSELGLIRSGLESPKSSESYKYAAKMDKKFRAGKSLSPYETGRLAILNANQIAAEQEAQSVARQNARSVSNIGAGATATATGANTLAVAEPANAAQSPARLTAQFTMPDGSLMTAQTVTGNTATTRATPAATQAATPAARTSTRFAPSNASGALQTLENNATQLDYDDDVRSGIVTNAARIESKGADLNSVNRTGYDTAARTVKGIMRNYGNRGTSNDIGKVQRIGMGFAAADDAALDRDYIENYADVLIGVANQNGAGYEFTPAELANDVITGTTTTDAKAVSRLKDALKVVPQKDVALRAAVYGEDPALVEQAQMLSNGDYSFIRAGEASPTQRRIAQAIQNTLDMNSPDTQGLIDNSRATTGAELVPALTEYVIRNNGIPSEFSRIFTDGGAAVTAAVQNNNRGIISAAQRGAVSNDTNGSISERGDVSDGDMGRAYGERAGESREGILGGTGEVETGRQAETVSDSRAAFTESIRGSQFVTEHRLNSSAGEIVYNEISPEALTDRADAQEIIERNAARGINTVFVAGNITVGTQRIRGFALNNTIYIQYDNAKYTPDNINGHEFVHTQANTEAYKGLMNSFVKRMTQENRAALEQLYAVMSRRYGTEAANYLRRAVEQNPGIDATSQGQILSEYIMEEIIADLNAGMDEAGQYSERFADELGAFRWETMNEAQRTQTVEQENTSSEAAVSPAEYAEETDAGGVEAEPNEKTEQNTVNTERAEQESEQSDAGKKKTKAEPRLSLDDDYSRIAEINTEMRDLRGKIKEIENSDDYSRIFDLVKEDPEKFVTEYAKWLNESGYGEASKRLEELQNEHDQLIKNIDSTVKQQALNDEQVAIKKSGLSEADYFRRQSVKEFGYTPYFDDAGYILPNGKMLNFSGEKGQHHGSRGQDHRDIGIIYANTTGSKAMVRFMSDGNIRIMPEGPGIDLSADVEPTKEQYATIRRLVREYAPKNEYFAIDFTDKSGRTVGQYEYTNNITADKITNDIRYFYENGKTREQSFSDVRFSKADDIDTPQFKDWFGDWENDPENASKVVNADGTPKVVYHQTAGGFTVFDTKQKGAGTSDNETPFGVFMKSSDKDIGLRGKTQMALYADIKNPLIANNRHDLTAQLRRISPEYSVLLDENSRLDEEYQIKFDQARNAVRNFRLQWRKDNPEADSRSLYDVKAYNELDDKEDQIIEEWKTKADNLSTQAKTVLTRALRSAGYDGVILHNDVGSFGRSTDAYIALDPTQIKSATDNIGTYDKTNPDIRYSIENLSTQDLLLEIANGISYRNDLIKAAKKNRSEVRELINDKQHLKDSLENAKRQMTRTKVPRANIGEVGKVTRKVLKSVSSKADIKELAPRIVAVYNSYFKEMHSAGYVESLENDAAENLAIALQNVAAEIVEGSEMWTDGEDYRDLVAYLRGTPIKLTDKLKSDIHYNEFRKRNFGTLRLSDNGIPVESLWAEMREIFPQIFNEDIANPADQLEAIEDAINRLRPKRYNPMQGHEAEAMDFIIEQFMAETDNIVEKKTKADKAYEKAQKNKETALEKQRQKFERKTAQLNEEVKEREDKLIQRLNEERWARYWDAEDAKADRERQEYQQYWEKRLINEKTERKVAHKDEVIANIRERRKVAIMKAHIRNTANDLSARLKNPKGAPAELVQSIAEICSKLDFSTDRTGEKTNLRLLELRSAYEAIAQDPDYDLAAEGSGIVAEMSERIKELDGVIKGKRVADLNVQELSDLNDILKEIRHAIIYANKQIGKAEARTNKELAQSVISGLDSLKDYDRNLVSKLVTGYGTQVMNSMRLAEMMSGYDENSVLYTMFSDLNEGIRRQARLRMDFQKPFDNLVNGRGNGRLYQEFMDKPVKTGFKYSDGTDVELPKRMICEIIMLWDREQGRSHLEQGGFTVPDFKKLDAGDFKGAFEKSRLRTVGAAYQPDSEGNMVVVAGITDKDINRLRGMLDNYDKLWMRNARAFFNGQAQASLNETHMALRGRKVATAENYIPLHTNTNFVRSEIEGLSMDATIEGNGHLKSVVPNASQPVFLLGLPATVQEHIDFVSKYSGLAIPIRNFNKIYNVTTRNDSGRLDSVKNALNQKWGAGVVKYGVEQLLTDLQTSRRKASDPFSKMLGKVQSNWVAATLNGNISVCIKQAASYPTAMYVVGTKPLAKALKAKAGVKHGDLLAEIDEHTGLHYLRRLGLSTQELGDRATSSAFIKRLTDKIDATLIDKGISSSILPSNWIQTVDVATTETLWLAAKYYVEDELKLSQSDPEYWDNVTQTYEAIIEETQPNYDVMHRPEIQKTTNALTRSLIMFATQPLQNSGMLYSSIGNLKAKNKALAEARANYEKNKNKQNADIVKTAEAAQRIARGRLARSVTGLVTSAVTFTIMTALARFALHNIKRYRDEKDKGKVSMKKVVLSALDDLMSQGITMLFPAFGGTVQEFVGLVQSGFDYEIPVTQMVNDTKDAVAKFGKAWNDVNSTSAYLPPNEKLAKFKDAANDLLKIVGEFTGVPITNYENIVNGVTKYAKDIISGAAFSSDASEYKPKYVYSYADLAGAIISGDAAKEKKIVQYFDDAGRKKENKKGKKEFDKGQLTKYLKPAYVAYVKDNPKEAARVKKSLIDRYGYTAKMIDGWLEEKKK